MAKINIPMDYEAIRKHAYSLHQQNKPRNALLEQLIQLDSILRNCELQLPQSQITVETERLEERTHSFEQGRYEQLQYAFYDYQQPSVQLLHWLIAEKEFILKKIVEFTK